MPSAVFEPLGALRRVRHRVAYVEDRVARHDDAAALRPKVNRAALIALARDLPTAWNAPGTDARTKQRITHILIREVVLDRDDTTNEAIVIRTRSRQSANSAASCRIASWP